MMNIKETFSQALGSLGANKLRTALTLLAILIGVFAIIAAQTAVLVLDNYFQETMSMMGGNVLQVSKYPSIRTGGIDWDKYRSRKDITFETMEDLIERIGTSKGISPDERFTTTSVKYSENETEPNVSIRGGNQYYLSNEGFSIDEGRNLSFADVEKNRPVAVIGWDVRDALFDVAYPIGKNIRIDGHPYKVIGVTEKRGSVFGQSLDNFVLIPYTTLMNVYGSRRNINISVKAPSMSNLDAAQGTLIGILRTIRKVAPGKSNDFEITSNESLSSAFDQFTGYLYIGGFVIGFIALLGAGIGVMNIMLVSVTERTKEIGLRKAVGATKQAITSQFLMEAILICQIGGLLGLLMGVLGGNLLAYYMSASVVFPWTFAIGGIVAMTVLGLAFGVYPAFKASRLDPIESLRYE
ncbi:MAG TPA: ABC transporter permease [Balneolaceae bacterium]|nr:ABC transporter permease [Balneolaceae bacterium]